MSHRVTEKRSPLTRAELSLLLQAGEGQRIEFKEKPGASLAKEFAAFANAEGGRIILGVNDANRDRVEISDPGGLPPGLKRSELGRKSVHRNPLIADLFHRLGDVEKIGSGIRRMREAAKAAGVPAPRFEATGFFTITYRKPARASGHGAPSGH